MHDSRMTTIQVPFEASRAVKELAHRRGVPMRQLLETAIREYLARQEEIEKQNELPAMPSIKELLRAAEEGRL